MSSEKMVLESAEEAQVIIKQLQAQQQTQDRSKNKKKDKDSKGSLAGTILLGTLAIDGGLLADDVTGVGVVDDVAIVPVTVVGAVLTELVDLGIDANHFFAHIRKKQSTGKNR